MTIGKKAANEKKFSKSQPITSGEKTATKTHQIRHTQNPPQKAGKDYEKACRKKRRPFV